MNRPAPSTLSVREPFAVRKRGGRRLVIPPDGETHRPRPRVDSALVNLRNNSWLDAELIAGAPAGARSVRVILVAEYAAGSHVDAYFDDIHLDLGS